VAARAGIVKTTIYRRWGGLDGLLADLMAEHAAQEIPVPDEGNFDADVRKLARGVVISLREPAIRAAFASMVAAAVQNRSAREVLSRFLAARTAEMTVIIDRAALRGELPPVRTLGVAPGCCPDPSGQVGRRSRRVAPSVAPPSPSLTPGLPRSFARPPHLPRCWSRPLRRACW
jgi:AcrR family transcriptional regulator